MLYFCASWYGAQMHWTALANARVRNVLLSFADIHRFNDEAIADYRRSGRRLLLDSGAFTAWSTGRRISLSKYIAYVSETGQFIFDDYFVLDLIPGRKGWSLPTIPEIEEAAERSYVNLQIMKQAGLRPVPVYHQQERLRWLKQMLDDGESFIGISPRRFLKLDLQRRWIDRVFRVVDGRVKVHGLGVSSFDMITAWPWFSTDGTTWARTATNGAIFIPAYRGDVPDYSMRPVKISVSSRNWRSLRPLPMPKEHVCDYFGRHRVSLNLLRGRDATERLTLNAVYFRDLENHLNRTIPSRR